MFLLERGKILGGSRDLDRFVSVRELVDFPGMPGIRWSHASLLEREFLPAAKELEKLIVGAASIA